METFLLRLFLMLPPLGLFNKLSILSFLFFVYLRLQVDSKLLFFLMSKMARGRLLLSQSICTDFNRFFYDTVFHTKNSY